MQGEAARHIFVDIATFSIFAGFAPVPHTMIGACTMHLLGLQAPAAHLVLWKLFDQCKRQHTQAVAASQLVQFKHVKLPIGDLCAWCSSSCIKRQLVQFKHDKLATGILCGHVCI